MEMNYCRRCGADLVSKSTHMFVCDNHHTIYANSSPAVVAILFNAKDEILTVRRTISPGMGELDIPGGFCDHHETGESALARELLEEIGLSPEHYSTPQFLCTGIDDYEFKDETVPVLSLIYTATVKDGAPIVAADDARDAEFTPLESVNPSDIYFNAPREAIVLLKKQKGFTV